MSTNPLKQGAMINHSNGIGTVTEDMVRARAAELAVINGRAPQDASEADWDQARRELAGEPDIDPETAVLESAPESERWDPLPGSMGHKTPTSSSEDEDDDGRSDSARLVEEGVSEAEHDQMFQAGKDAAKDEDRNA